MPGSPAPRLPFTCAWHYPVLPFEPGGRAVFATITANNGRSGTVEIRCTGTHTWQIIAGGVPQQFTDPDAIGLREAAESAGMILGANLCKETI